MSLKVILEEIQQLTPVAEEVLEEGAIETLSGRRGRQRNALERLSILKTAYLQELRGTAAFIIVMGSNKSEFAEIAKSEFKCFTADAEHFYKDLAERIPPVFYDNKSAVSYVFDVVGRHLEDKASELGILGYPMLRFKQEYARHLSNKEDLVTLLKEAINQEVGPEIVGLQALKDILDQAIGASHEGRITPIVMTTDDEKLALDLKNSLGRIGSKSFLVVAGKGSKNVKNVEGVLVAKEAQKENVENVLTNIRNLIN